MDDGAGSNWETAKSRQARRNERKRDALQAKNAGKGQTKKNQRPKDPKVQKVSGKSNSTYKPLSNFTPSPIAQAGPSEERSYAEATGITEEIGDLTLEEENEFSQSQGCEKGAKYVPLYVHLGREKRLPITRQDFTDLWKVINDRAMQKLMAGIDLPYSVKFIGEKNGRGIIGCANETSAKFLTNEVSAVTVGKKCFKAWRRGSSGTTLVTVIVKDKNICADKNLNAAIVWSNKLNNLGSLESFRVTKNPENTTRIVRFGAAGKLLERLRELHKETNGILKVTYLECSFKISSKSTGDVDPEGETPGTFSLPEAPTSSATTEGTSESSSLACVLRAANAAGSAVLQTADAEDEGEIEDVDNVDDADSDESEQVTEPETAEAESTGVTP